MPMFVPLGVPFDGGHLLAGQHVAVIGHRRGKNVMLMELFQPFISSAGRKDLVEHVAQPFPMMIPSGAVAIGMVLKMFQTGDAAERGPSARVHSGQAEVPVFGFEAPHKPWRN